MEYQPTSSSRHKCARAVLWNERSTKHLMCPARQTDHWHAADLREAANPRPPSLHSPKIHAQVANWWTLQTDLITPLFGT
jgi:hypothetical protein